MWDKQQIVGILLLAAFCVVCTHVFLNRCSPMTYLVLNEDTRIVVRGFESRAAATSWIGQTNTYRDSVGLERARYRVIPVRRT